MRGRTQGGNNNAYAQDNPVTWLNWEAADSDLATYVRALALFRQNYLEPGFNRFLTAAVSDEDGHGIIDVAWWRADGMPMESADWGQADAIGMTLRLQDCVQAGRMHVVFNRSETSAALALPKAMSGKFWRLTLDSAAACVETQPWRADLPETVPPRSVCAFAEMAED